MNLLTIYQEFITLKESIIEQALKEAAFCEKRPTGNVRPLVVLKSEIHAKQWQSKIDSLKALTEKLTKGDPVRFKASAKLFNPPPALFTDIYRVDIREAESSSQKKIEKAKIIKRMKNLLEAEKHNSISSGDNSKIHQIVDEIKAMENDGEEFYLRRATGYKDFRCLIYLSKDSNEPIKASLSFSGMFIRPAVDAPENFLSLPQQSRQLIERSDKLDLSGVTQVKHSLAMRGKLYRYSEFMAAKKLQKTPPAF